MIYPTRCIGRLCKPAKRVVRSATVFVAFAAIGCHHSHPITKPPVANQPSAYATQLYSNASAGISFQYPVGWTTGKGKTAVFQADSPDKAAHLNLDVPSLPFHLPGMITPVAVANGYINDVKKRLGNPVVEQNDPVTIPDGSGRRVKVTGSSAGQTCTDAAILIVHDDKVFILSSDGTGAGTASAATALDAAFQSLRWKG